MKLFFRFLFILILFILYPATARQVKTKTPAIAQKTITQSSLPLSINNESSPELPAPLSKKTYQQLRNDIATMDSNMVVAPDGIFTDYFIKFIKENVQKSQLSGVFVQALLEAGMNLHAQLNEDNAFTKRALQRNTQQISDIINSLLPARPQQKQMDTPVVQPTQPVQSNPQQPRITKESNRQPAAPITKMPVEPIASPKPQSQPIEYKKNLSGPAGLKEFRKQSINEPLEAFYSRAIVNPEWLKKALDILLNGQPLTSTNKDQMKGELVGNATELIRELLHKNHVANNQWNIFIESVEKQAVTFMDNQLLPDQKQAPSPLPTKTPQTELNAPRSKIPAFEPQQTPTQKLALKPDKDPHVPTWITPQHTLLIKDLEIEILRYIFVNQEASQEAIGQHFIQQVPKNIKLRKILINGIKATVGKILQEPLEPDFPLEAPQAPTHKASSKNKPPYWIDPQGLNIKPSNLDQEIAKFIAGNMNASNDDIANHFINLVPANMPHKKLIERQIQDTIEDFFAR